LDSASLSIDSFQALAEYDWLAFALILAVTSTRRLVVMVFMVLSQVFPARHFTEVQ
jgi:hypothetical protein